MDINRLAGTGPGNQENESLFGRGVVLCRLSFATQILKKIQPRRRKDTMNRYEQFSLSFLPRDFVVSDRFMKLLELGV